MTEHPRMTEHDKPSAADGLPTPNGDQAPDEFSRKRDAPPAQPDATEQQRTGGVAGASTWSQGSGVMAARSALDQATPQPDTPRKDQFPMKLELSGKTASVPKDGSDVMDAQDQFPMKLELSRRPATAATGSGKVMDAQDQFPMKLELSRNAHAAGLATAALKVGSGVMAARSALDESPPQREALDRAAHAARTTGHRFDLLRYLRLKRGRADT
jgi:hypothetical protein